MFQLGKSIITCIISIEISSILSVIIALIHCPKSIRNP